MKALGLPKETTCMRLGSNALFWLNVTFCETAAFEAIFIAGAKEISVPISESACIAGHEIMRISR